MAAGVDLRDLVSRHLGELASETLPHMILALVVVVSEGKTALMVALNQEVAGDAPDPRQMSVEITSVLRDYLDRCPSVVSKVASGDAPS